MPVGEVAGRLDTGGARGELTRGLTGPLGTLANLEVPASTDDLQAAGRPAQQIDTDGILRAARGALERLTPMLANLPVAGDAIAPIQGALTLAEGLIDDGLVSELRALLQRAAADLEGDRPGGLVDVLAGLVDLPGTSPKLREILGLVSSALRAANVDVGALSGLGEVVPAVAHVVRGLAALMALETTLAEGERLTAIMQRQLDPAEVAAHLGSLRGALAAGPGGLVAAIEALDPADGAAVEAAAQAIASAAGRLDDVTAFLARAMGFGEATLVHLDLAGLERQVQASTAMLRQVDAAVVGRAVSALVGKLTPVFSLDLGTPVASGLDALLALLEEKAADIAAAVAGVELGAVTGPLTEGLGAVTGVIGQISDALGRVTQAVRTSLETVRTAVAAVPLDEVVGAIRGVLDVVTQALDAVRGVVDRVSGTLNDVAGTATTAIGLAEEAVDNFKKAVDDLLKQAADFVEELHLADAIGKIADQVNGFAQALGRVQMRPYFDQASEVIGTTADVVGALPLGLLPDSVKSDLDRAVAPIRAIDLPALETEVEGWFQIRDGKFALRAPLESALSEVQEKIRDLITAVESADPRQLIEPINNELGQIAGKIRELEPQLTLAPLAEAIDRVKGMLGSFDLRATLAPVTEVFDQILAAIDQYSPAALIQPLEERVDAIRTRVTQAIRLDDWLPRLDAMVAQGRGLLDRLDPTRLEPLITEGFNEARAQLARIDGFHPAAMLGEFVTSMLAGSGLKLHPWTFQAVIGWLTGDASGSSQLAARAGRIADAVDVTRAAVAGVDLGALAQELEARAVAVRAAVALRLPGGSPARLRLDRALGGLQPAAALGALAAHRLRYVGALEAAGALTAGVRAMGLSQVDASLRALVAAVSPARALGEMKDKLLAQLGLRGIEGGLRGVLEHVLAIASPARLSRILLPIFLSLRARITALVDAVLAPVREGITRFQEVVAAFDLSPLREGLQGVVDEVKDQVRLMSPVEILKPQIEAWEALQATLLAFDPLGPLLDVVNAFKAAAERVLGKLRGEELLAQPIRIYDEILEAVRALDVEELTRPVLDALDDLAGQIDEGLDGTVTALERLQQALPAPGAGGGSASASGSMGVS